MEKKTLESQGNLSVRKSGNHEKKHSGKSPDL